MQPGSIGEIFLIFLRLGLTSFGGPVAHLGYFRAEFVENRRWLDESAFAELVGLCQFLPGPASSQCGFALGMLRAGLMGGLAAWLGFTIPSAVIMISLALAGASLFLNPPGSQIAHGLQIAAVAVVAQAVWRLGRVLCPDKLRLTMTTLSAATMLVLDTPALQVLLILTGALVGARLIPLPPASKLPVEEHPVQFTHGSTVKPAAALILFGLLLLVPPVTQPLAAFNAFYRSGALVFGGGHVVLPLLESATAARGWVSQSAFLAGYGAAQALPGPVFTFAGFLGASMNRAPNGIAGGLLAIVAIFLPGLLLLSALLPFWGRVRRFGRVRSAVAGVNATVVGLLLAALYNPVWVSAIRSPRYAAVAFLAFLLLEFWAMPSWAVVLACGLTGLLL